MNKLIAACAAVAILSGCVTNAEQAEWAQEVAECEASWGNAVVSNGKYERFYQCLSGEQLERTKASEMACLEAGNLPRYRGEVVGYGRIYHECTEPEKAKVKIFFD